MTTGGPWHLPSGSGTHGKAPLVSCLELTTAPDAVRTGRHFVEDAVRAAGAAALLDDVALVASELLGNAYLHGAPPVRVHVEAQPDHVRLEVHDGSNRAPLRTLPSGQNMTGRGLTLVDQLTDAWGVEMLPGEGKVVWAEFTAGRQVADADVDALLAAWDDEPEPGEPRFAITLGELPTDLLLEAKAHIDNVVREFSLLAGSGVVMPPHLERLADVVIHGFGDARTAIKRQALAAAERGEPTTRLSLYLPASAADAGEAYLAALDEADAWSRSAQLLTLETPARHKAFRTWYVSCVITALRQAARGEPVTPAPAFEA
ncbi:MAG: ATP-binding protein [Mycobacteriales bacterium]